jgi:hypothetical protein
MSDMRTPADINVSPIVNEEWWKEHVAYSKFRRQGIDIICASFVQSKPKANVIFLTGLMESFLKYSEFIEFLYEKGFNVFTYDHQSQGFSGRCKLLLHLMILQYIFSDLVIVGFLPFPIFICFHYLLYILPCFIFNCYRHHVLCTSFVVRYVIF